MTNFLRTLFFLLIVRPIILIVLGLNVRHRERLPRRGPALIVANHNSHLDTMVLMSLFPIKALRHIRPAAAMDYFLSSRLKGWFSLNIIGVIPVDRNARSRGEDPFAGVSDGLNRRDIIILFPEGTRGAPEELAEFKKGVSHLVERHPDVPTTPVFLHGLGKVMPKGSMIPVPFFVDVFIGDRIKWPGDRDKYMSTLNRSVAELAAQGQFPSWE